MTLLEKIAAKFGFHRPPPLELIVFRSLADAREAGFRSGNRHPMMPHVFAWWPSLGPAGLATRPFRRVTIEHHMCRHQTSEGRLVDILYERQRVWGDKAIWVKL